MADPENPRPEDHYFAFGIANFLTVENSETVKFADYGSINAYYEIWDAENDVFVKIQTRNCTADDFGLNGYVEN
jgi:hypothetical protein